MKTILICSLGFALLLSSCGSDSGSAALFSDMDETGSCTSKYSGDFDYQMCVEYGFAGANASRFIDDAARECSDSGNGYQQTWSSDFCNRDGAVGGCSLDVSQDSTRMKLIIWYYEGTEAQVRESCDDTWLAGQKSEFVAP